MISLPTIQALELIRNLRNPASKACLFGLLKQTTTPMGARMLRSNILQPSTQAEGVLIPRYDALEELCTKEDMFFSVRNALKPFGDIEKLLSKLILLPTEPSLGATEQAINNVLLIKNFVVAIPALYESLATARCALLVKIRDHCRPDITNPILGSIAEVINEDVSYVSKPLDLRNQRGVSPCPNLTNTRSCLSTSQPHSLCRQGRCPRAAGCCPNYLQRGNG